MAEDSKIMTKAVGEVHKRLVDLALELSARVVREER